MRLASCLPTIIFLILAGSGLASRALRGNLHAESAVSLVAFAALLQVLCAYGHEMAAWVLLGGMFVLPIGLVVVGLVATMMRPTDE